MITINGQQYNEPLNKGLPYYRLDTEKGIAAILPYNATKYPTFKEHLCSLKTFFSRKIALTPISISSYKYNRLELSQTITDGRRIPLPTYLKEGLDGPGEMYDHINNNETDDTDDNLRPVNATQNSYNKKLAKNNTSGFKGVRPTSSKAKTKSWTAFISCDGKTYSGLTYKNKPVAALAYNELAKIHHGEYASLNLVTAEMLQELAKDPTMCASLIKDLSKLDNRYGTSWSQTISI
jgi:hypothetical protein